MNKKIIYLILIFVLNFQLYSRAEDVKDFEIEGISIGDSLSLHYSKDQINNFYPVNYPSSDRFVGRETDESITFNEYTAMTFHFKKNDNKKKIVSIKGMLNYPNKIDDCLNKKEEIVEQIESNINFHEKNTYESYFGKKYGKSTAYITDFDFIDGDAIRVWCTVWDKNNEGSKSWIDTLNVSVGTKVFYDFLNNEAFK